jgi:hypothetical protein
VAPEFHNQRIFYLRNQFDKPSAELLTRLEGQERTRRYAPIQ